MKITFAEDGWSEYLYWQTQDKKNIKKDKSVVAKYRTRWGIGGNRETRTIEIWKIRLLQPAD